MKLCPQCNASPLPFVMVAVIAAVIGLVTWLTLGLSDWDAGARLAISAGAFGAVALTLWHYVVSCIRRHCPHRHAHHQHDSRHMTPSSPGI
jgi:hypothetical protein